MELTSETSKVTGLSWEKPPIDSTGSPILGTTACGQQMFWGLRPTPSCPPGGRYLQLIKPKLGLRLSVLSPGTRELVSAVMPP